MSKFLSSTSLKKPIKVFIALGLSLLSVLLVSGCTAKESEMLGGPVVGYNHTSAAINRFTVNGAGGPNIGPYGEGGQVCCGSVPRVWRPGLRAIVEWEKDPTPRGYGSWPEEPFSDAWSKRMEEHRSHYTHHTATVEIPKYDVAGTIKVHFLPCDQVRVSANNMFVGDPRYPYNFPEKMEDTECPNS